MEHREPEITSPPAGVIRSRSFRNSHNEPGAAHARVIRLKTEPEDGEGEIEEGRGDVREKETGRDAGEEQKEISAQLKRNDAERCLENMTETDV